MLHHMLTVIIKKNASSHSPLIQNVIDPNQLRWKPFGIPTEPTDFVQGLRTIAHGGDATVKHGIAVRIFSILFLFI